MICGIGGAPIASLGYAYVDDYTEKHESAFYIGKNTSLIIIEFRDNFWIFTPECLFRGRIE